MTKEQTYEVGPFYRGMIKEQEAQLSTVEVCRRHGLSAAAFYKLTAKHGGLQVSDGRHLHKPSRQSGL